MKFKTILLCIFAIASSIVSQAQIQVSPKLIEGMKVVYTTSTTTEGSSPLNAFTSETEYTVSQVSPQGAVIIVSRLNPEVNTDSIGLMAQLTNLENTVLSGLTTNLSTDNHGKVIHVLNIEEIKRKGTEFANKLVEETLKAHPNLKDVFPKSFVIGVTESLFTEQTIIDMHCFNGIMALNGKTITNGLTEHLSHDGMKLKRVFSIEGKDIVATTTLDMTTEEQIEYFICQMQKHAPEQAETFKQNKERLAKFVNFEINNTCRYEIDDDGWVKSLKNESTKNNMGKSTKTVTYIKRL